MSRLLEGVSYCLIHRRVFLAIHPFSRHRNAPTTSAAPMCVAQGRVASHHPAERRAPVKCLSPPCRGSGHEQLLTSLGRDSTAPTALPLQDTSRVTWHQEHPESRRLTWGHHGVQGSLRQAVLPLVSQGWKWKSVCAC